MDWNKEEDYREESLETQEQESHSVKNAILAQFEIWLDTLLQDAETDVPPGIPELLLHDFPDSDNRRDQAEQDPMDAYGLWSAMTALAHEVKLQGRVFKQTCDALMPFQELPGTVTALMDAYKETMAHHERQFHNMKMEWVRREQEVRDTVRHQTLREMISMLIELLERLRHGASAAREHGASIKALKSTSLFDFLRRNRSEDIKYQHAHAATLAMEEGYQISCRRIEELLHQLGVSEICCMGQPFNPAYMRAAEIEVTNDKPEGTVTFVHRTGFFWNDQVFQPAQVKVTRHSET